MAANTNAEQAFSSSSGLHAGAMPFFSSSSPARATPPATPLTPSPLHTPPTPLTPPSPAQAVPRYIDPYTLLLSNLPSSLPQAELQQRLMHPVSRGNWALNFNRCKRSGEANGQAFANFVSQGHARHFLEACVAGRIVILGDGGGHIQVRAVLKKLREGQPPTLPPESVLWQWQQRLQREEQRRLWAQERRREERRPRAEQWARAEQQAREEQRAREEQQARWERERPLRRLAEKERLLQDAEQQLEEEMQRLQEGRQLLQKMALRRAQPVERCREALRWLQQRVDDARGRVRHAAWELNQERRRRADEEFDELMFPGDDS